MSVPSGLLDVYKRQKYQLVGGHSAVKTCHWTRQALRTSEGKVCYKQKFYGIRSVSCLQMTPALGRCLQSCLFCWRAMNTDVGLNWDQTEFLEENADEAERIVEGSIAAQRRGIMGFKGFKGIHAELLSHALNPEHAAISLDGEPTMYPWIGRLIEEYFSHSFKTVLLVTSGLLPNMLRKINTEPSQLYVSVSAPDKQTYDRVCRPLVANGWERLQETLGSLRQFSCRTAMRLTLVKGINLMKPEGYAKLIAESEPTYVEAKAAMAVGFFLNRLDRSAMPTHKDIQDFAERISSLTGYRIIDESSASSVVLLSRLKKSEKLV
ncbi:MAG: 4-demethylwyosine synthase TYW1 [archaeon]